MDIESVENRALQGAQNIITNQKPILVIAAYHELSHLLKILLLIKSMNEEYQLHFAHHMWNMADTVCYGTI